MTESTHTDSSNGFTLIEMLVTITLMSIVSLLAWQALDATGRSVIRSQDISTGSTALVRTLDQISADIASHALLEPPYPDRSGQLRRPDAPPLPASITWSDNRLTVLQRSRNGELTPVRWHIRHNSLTRSTPHEPEQTALRDVNRLSLKAWIDGRGWIEPGAIPAGLRATGLEVIIEQTRGNGEAGLTFRKVVLLP